jgi:hypothetical protein
LLAWGGELARRAADDLHFFIDGRILHLEVEHEPVELGLGQRIGPFHFDRVLRGDHEERRLELVGLAANRDFAFLHSLQQGGLRFRRRAVDFVGQEEVREHWPLHERDAVLAGGLVLFHDVRAGDVSGHQVGRELDAAELHFQRAGQRAGHQRFAQARHAEHQDVPATQEADQERVDDLVLADHDLAHLLFDAVAGFAKTSDHRHVFGADIANCRRQTGVYPRASEPRGSKLAAAVLPGGLQGRGARHDRRQGVTHKGPRIRRRSNRRRYCGPFAGRSGRRGSAAGRPEPGHQLPALKSR